MIKPSNKFGLVVIPKSDLPYFVMLATLFKKKNVLSWCNIFSSLIKQKYYVVRFSFSPSVMSAWKTRKSTDIPTYIYAMPTI